MRSRKLRLAVKLAWPSNNVTMPFRAFAVRFGETSAALLRELGLARG